MIAAANTAPKSFNDFTQIKIGTSNLSSSTVSKRIKELVGIKVFEETIIRSDTGRRIIGYKTTERGRRVLELAQEFKMVMRK